VKTGWSISSQVWQNLLRKAVDRKDCFSNDDDDDISYIDIILNTRLYNLENGGASRELVLFPNLH
jgi:hypothetical protein